MRIPCVRWKTLSNPIGIWREGRRLQVVMLKWKLVIIVSRFEPVLGYLNVDAVFMSAIPMTVTVTVTMTLTMIMIMIMMVMMMMIMMMMTMTVTL